MHTIAPSPTVVITEDVRARAPGLFVERATAEQLHVSNDAPHLDAAIAEILNRWNASTADELVQAAEILSYRELSRRFSDPFGAVAPAVENLVTRYLMKGKFPRINSLVDAANVASLQSLIPIGLFDLEAIAGDLTLGMARGDEEIVPIGKSRSERVPAGFPLLRDEEKVLSIVGVRDSALTRIVPATTAVLAFSWGLEGVSRERVRATLSTCTELCRQEGITV